MDQSSRGPLAGIRILEVGGIGPLPFAGMMLADLGASITRVDRPGDELGLQANNPVFRGRKSVHLDLRNPAHFEVMQQLISEHDILLEGFRPRVMERLGLGPDEVRSRHPGIIYGRVTGYGAEGRFADKGGHDINYIALSGALHAIGTKATPVLPLNLIGDYAGGSMMLIMGLLAALHQRDRTGQGLVVEAAMADGAVALMNWWYSLLNLRQFKDERMSNMIDGGAPFYGVYKCRDERFVAVGAFEPKFFSELIDALGVDPVYKAREFDKSVWPQMKLDFEQKFMERDRDEWVEHFAAYDACVSPVLSLSEAMASPINLERDMFARVNGAPTAVMPVKFDGARLPVNSKLAHPGQHTPREAAI